MLIILFSFCLLFQFLEVRGQIGVMMGGGGTFSGANAAGKNFSQVLLGTQTSIAISAITDDGRGGLYIVDNTFSGYACIYRISVPSAKVQNAAAISSPTNNVPGLVKASADAFYITSYGPAIFRCAFSPTLSCTQYSTGFVHSDKIWGDAAGNLFVTDADNPIIRMIRVNSPLNPVVIAGGGPSTPIDGVLPINALFNNPTAIGGDAYGNLFVGGHRLSNCFPV